MKVVALLARKGGTGKTTIAIHLACIAQAEGRRVLFFDLDPQRSLSAWWQSRSADTPGLAETDARRLPALLAAAEVEGYDLAIIDTPPAISFATAQVAELADLAVIPLRPSILDIYAVESTVLVVQASKTPALLVLNACMAGREAGEASSTIEARTALQGLGVPVADASLAQRMDYTRALNGGEAVNEFAPSSRAAAEMARLWADVAGRLGL